MAQAIDRRAPGGWMAKVNWRELGESALRAIIALGWFGFVASLLAKAVLS